MGDASSRRSPPVTSARMICQMDCLLSSGRQHLDDGEPELAYEIVPQVMDLLRRLNEELGKTLIMVTHDPKTTEYARQTLHLDKGRLSAEHAR